MSIYKHFHNCWGPVRNGFSKNVNAAPVLWNTKAGLILTVKLGSVLCINYSSKGLLQNIKIHSRGVITTKATKAAALVVFWDYNELGLANLKKKISLFSTKQKISLSILCLAELKKWISFYQAKNLLKYAESSLQIWRNKYLYYSTKHKKKTP